MSRAPVEPNHLENGASASICGKKTWSSIVNREEGVDLPQKVVVQQSEEKPFQRRGVTNSAPNQPGRRLARENIPSSAIVLDDGSDTGANSSSVQRSPALPGALHTTAQDSSSESDDDENDARRPPVTEPLFRRPPRTRRRRRLTRARSTDSLDSCESGPETVAPVPREPSLPAAQVDQQHSAMGTNTRMALQNGKTAAAASSPQPGVSAMLSPAKRQRINQNIPQKSSAGHKDVASKATALLLLQQRENLNRKGRASVQKALKKSIGKCTLCQRESVALSEKGLCLFRCYLSGKATNPGAEENRQTFGNTPGKTSLPQGMSRPLTSAAANAVVVNRPGNPSTLLGKRNLIGLTNSASHPPPAQSLTGNPKSILLINLTDSEPSNPATKDRLKFFSFMPTRFDFSPQSAISKFSPFACAADGMEGVSSKDVCAVCGSSNGLVECRRCPLAFHRSCHYPPLKGIIRNFCCRACTSGVKAPFDPSRNGLMSRERARPLSVENAFLRIRSDAADGNPMDLILHPSLHRCFTRHYKTDWLRCNRCNRTRHVGARSLSESVRIPFECSDAFWTSPDQRSCDVPLSAEEKAQLIHANARIRNRSKRRVRLFYHNFGEQNRSSYGFISPGEVVCLDSDDDDQPAAKSIAVTVPSPVTDPKVSPTKDSDPKATSIIPTSGACVQSAPKAMSPPDSLIDTVLQSRVSAPIPPSAIQVRSSSQKPPSAPAGPVTQRVPLAHPGHGGNAVPTSLPMLNGSRQIPMPVASSAPPNVSRIGYDPVRRSVPASSAVYGSLSNGSTPRVSATPPTASVRAIPSPPTPAVPAASAQFLGSSFVRAPARAQRPTPSPPMIPSSLRPASVLNSAVGNVPNQILPERISLPQASFAAQQNQLSTMAVSWQGVHPARTPISQAVTNPLYQRPISAPELAAAQHYAHPPQRTQQPQQPNVSRNMGFAVPSPPVPASSDVQDVLLKRIAGLQQEADIEDQLVDLALAKNDTLIQLFNAFGNNPVRFARQAVRLARSRMNVSPPSLDPSGNSQAVWGNSHRGNGTEVSVLPQQHVDISGTTAIAQQTHTNALQGLRGLSASARHELNEKFRTARLQQLEQCIRLETAMAREMQHVPTPNVSQLHGSQMKAKKRMEARHQLQLRSVIQKVLQGHPQTPYQLQ